MTCEQELLENKSAVLTVSGNPETREDPAPQLTAQPFTSQQDTRTRRKPDKRLERRGALPLPPSQRGQAAYRHREPRWRPCFSLPLPAPNPDSNCATHFSWGSLISPHLNIYECCLASTFHYGEDCLAWGALNPFTPARACLGSLHFYPIAACTPQCLAATGGAAGAVETNERAKKQHRGGGGRARHAVKYGRIKSIRGVVGGVSGLQAKMKWTQVHEVERRADMVPPPREKYESNFQAGAE